MKCSVKAYTVFLKKRLLERCEVEKIRTRKVDRVKLVKIEGKKTEGSLPKRKKVRETGMNAKFAFSFR